MKKIIYYLLLTAITMCMPTWGFALVLIARPDLSLLFIGLYVVTTWVVGRGISEIVIDH